MLRVGAAAYARPYRTGAQADTHADGHTASEHVQPEPEPELRAAMRLALTRWHHDPPGPGPAGPAAPVSLSCNSGTQACTRTAGGVWRGDAYTWFRIVFRMVQCGIVSFGHLPNKNLDSSRSSRLSVFHSTRIYSHSHGLQRRAERGRIDHSNRRRVMRMVLLKSLQRRNFPLLIHRNLVLVQQLLVHTVRLVNARAEAGGITRCRGGGDGQVASSRRASQ